MQEVATSAFVCSQLEALGFEAVICGGTGVVGIYRNGDGPVVAFRADLDGLPVEEETGLPYASTARGRLADGTEVPLMHACGHDLHITCALGAARVLRETSETWAGTVVLLFQPGEETGQGARAMVEDGLWDRAPVPEVVYSQHVWPTLSGTVELASGAAMAVCDSWQVTVRGRGGHASCPQEAIDPIVLAAHMIVRAQSIVSREVHPLGSAVVTIATFHGGLKENVIADTAQFTVNVRSLEPEVREHVLAALKRVFRAEALASGAPEPTIEVMYDFPLLFNEPEATKGVREALAEAFGPARVRVALPQLGSEDFGHLTDAAGVPGVYWLLGGMSEETMGSPVVPSNHSPQFAPALEPTIGTGVIAAVTALKSKLTPAGVLTGSRAGSEA